jgi:phosphomannomutase/phosphoglucomutase
MLAAVAALMILIAGGVVGGVSGARLAEIRQDSATAMANAVALTLSQQIELLNKTLNKMARDPEVLAAITRADPVLLVNVAAKLERYFPSALKIRLLLPDVSEPDEINMPRMGFADLDMVRETFNNNQPSGIQGYEGADRHLAMTARIMRDDRVVGVILASLNYDFFNKSLQTAAVKNGAIELRQGNLVLGSSGRRTGGVQDNNVKSTVAGTNWEIYYHYAADAGLAEMIFIASIVGAPLLLALLAFFVGYRRLSDLLEKDLDSVLGACKAMMTHKPLGSYPTRLNEMTVVMSALMQFKRSLDHYGNESKAAVAREFELDETVHFDLSGLTLEDNRIEDYLAADRGETLKQPQIKVNYKPKTAAIMPDASIVFRENDIRGIAGKTLTREQVYDMGRALGTEAREHGCKTIVIGRDGRTSSPELAEELAQGIAAVGCNVLDIGRVPISMLYFVTRHTEGRCGAMITGGDSPPEYNGLKMIINGDALAGPGIQKIRQRMASGLHAEGEAGVIRRNSEFTGEYIGIIAEDIHIDRPMLVVLDCGNGVAGELGPVLLQALGCEVVELNCDIDGTFPNHSPDPSNPENLDELIASVRHYKADLGIAIDSDGDRLGVVDSNGNIVWPDRQMMLFAKDILAKMPGSEIIYDVKCSRHLGNQIAKYGGKPVMWKTGHSFIKTKLRETGAALAGEMSGHLFFNDRWFGFDDALYAAARLIEILSREAQGSAEIFARFPDAIATPELTVELAEGESISFMDSLVAEARFTDGKVTDIDGMRMDFPNGWGLVQASNTSPVLTVRFEADSKTALLDIEEQFRSLMKKIKPDIVLPF